VTEAEDEMKIVESLISQACLMHAPRHKAFPCQAWLFTLFFLPNIIFHVAQVNPVKPKDVTQKIQNCEFNS
jgi:hypothetical protein